MNELLSWCHANGLVTNTKETIAMSFHTLQKKKVT